METSNEKTSTGAQKTVCITRTLNLPIDKVWKGLSDAESMKKWWGPKDFTCPHCTIDFTEGGKYLACMKGPDGKEFWSTGVYEVIVPNKKIVYTDSFSDDKGHVIPASVLGMPGNWPLELLVILTLEEEDGKTKLSLQQDSLPEEAYDDCITGWQQCLDKLESNLK